MCRDLEPKKVHACYNAFACARAGISKVVKTYLAESHCETIPGSESRPTPVHGPQGRRDRIRSMPVERKDRSADSHTTNFCWPSFKRKCISASRVSTSGPSSSRRI